MSLLQETTATSIPHRILRPPILHIYDLLTVGFGTKALALATAIKDYNTSTNIVFLEKCHSFEERSHDQDPAVKSCESMQHSFMHDLVTFRNPTSEFTFLNYLQSQGKLGSFIELQGSKNEDEGFIRPVRDEFHSYLSWVARAFTNCVMYGEEVVEVSKANRYPQESLWRVISKNMATQETIVRFARNVVFANTEHMASIARDEKSENQTFSEEEPRPMEMLQVTHAINGLPERSSDDQFCTVALHSGEVLKEVFSENRLLVIRAML